MFNNLILFLADPLFVIIVFFCLIITYLKYNDLYKLVINISLATFVGTSIKYFLPVHRPFVSENFVPLITNTDSNSFPSIHVLIGLICGLTIYNKNKKLSAVILILALIVGYARVLGGIHRPIDIIGSVVISLIIHFFTRKLIIQRDDS